MGTYIDDEQGSNLLDLSQFPIVGEADAYDRMKAELEKEYKGRWVIISGGEKVGDDYDSYDDAAAAAHAIGLDVHATYIRQVGVDVAVFLSQGT